MTEDDARLRSVESGLDRVSGAVDRLAGEVATLAADVRALTTAEITRAAIASTRAEEDTQIRRLPPRVEQLESTLTEVRGWGSRKPGLVQLAESEHGRTLVRYALVAAVLCSMALGGGLVSADLPGLARAMLSQPVAVPMPVHPPPAMGPREF